MCNVKRNEIIPFLANENEKKKKFRKRTINGCIKSAMKQNVKQAPFNIHVNIKLQC